MGLKTVPAYIAQTGYLHPAELDRNLIETIFGRTGASRFGEFAVTPTGVSGQASIASGRAVLVGTENANQGAYFVYSDGADLQLFAAASGNHRVDTLLLRVKDDQYGTISGSPAAYWDIVQGVAAGSPVARVDADFNSGGAFYVPGAWWRVADVRRNLGDTTIPGGQITSNLRYVRNARGAYLVADATARGLVTDASEGDELYQIDRKLLFTRASSAWVQPYVRDEVTLTRTATQAHTSATEMRISFSAQGSGPSGYWAVSPNPTRIVIPNTGRYKFEVKGMTQTASAASLCWFEKNANAVRLAEHPNGAGSWGGPLHMMYEGDFTAGDYVEAVIFQNFGAINWERIQCWVERTA